MNPSDDTTGNSIILDEKTLEIARKMGASEEAVDLIRLAMESNDGFIQLASEDDLRGAFPLEEPKGEYVRAIVLFDPMHPEDHQAMTLDWVEGRTLSEYMGDLPDDITYEVSVNGVPIPAEMRPLTVLDPKDAIAVIANPGRGVGAMIAMIAVMVIAAVVAPYLAPALVSAMGSMGVTMTAAMATTIIGGVITTVGGMLVTSLMANNNKKSTSKTDDVSSPSYGLDGAKPTAQEGVNVPIIYGEYRTAGNRTDFYVENSPDGKTQTLYLRYVVSEGPIESISDWEINEQPIQNYSDVIVDWRAGFNPEVAIPWFNETLAPQTFNIELSQTPTVRNTTEPVDRIRVDVGFPAGLFETDKETGNRKERQVDVHVLARNLDTGQTFSLNERAWAFSSVVGTYLGQQGAQARATVRVLGQGGEPQTWRSVTILQKRSGIDDWQVAFSQAILVTNIYVSDGYWIPGHVDIDIQTPQYQTQGMFSDPSLAMGMGGYPWAVWDHNTTPTSGDLPQGFNFEISAPPFCSIISAEVLTANGQAIKRNERNPFRVSFHSPALPRGRYEVITYRSGESSTSDYVSDRVALQDIVEIQRDLVNFNRTAHYAARIRLSDQLNQEPSITCKVRGRRVPIIDRLGQVVDFRWSNNPADILADILLSGDFNTGIAWSRIDFPSLSRWRDFCTSNGLKFNGIFEGDTTIWDALQVVLRVGRANVALSGLKWSFVIEGPAEPTMLFGQHNIVKNSFENYWLNLEDRANQIEVQYYEENDKNKRNSVFWTDLDAIAAGEPVRSNTINLIGCTNRAQATKEATLQVNMNRGMRQGVRFDTFLDALSCAVGDVVYCQHDMPKWGWAGRIASVAWPYVLLDEQLDGAGEAGDWRILCLFPALLMGQPICTGVSGNQIRVTGNFLGARRLNVNGMDYRVSDAVLAGPETVFVTDRTVNGVVENVTGIQCWQIDALHEAQIEMPADGDSQIRIKEGSWGSFPRPESGLQVMVGRYGKFKKPFRIVRMGRKTDHTISIDALEYNEEIYGPGVITQPPNYSELDGSPQHVQSLSVSQRHVLGDAGYRYFGDFSWVRPLADQRRYAGAHVYLRLNGGQWTHIGSPLDPTETFSVEVSVNDVAQLKVQAFYSTGETASWDRAPTCSFSPGAVGRLPDPPVNLVAIGGVRLITCMWELPADPSVSRVEIWESAQEDQLTSYKVAEGMQTFFSRAGLDPLETRYYWARSVSFSGAKSNWVGPAMATTSQLIASDIQDGILDHAKFAMGIAPISIITDTSAPPSRDDEVAVSQADHKLYRAVRGMDGFLRWVAEVLAVDVTGQLTEEQIADLAIGPAKLAAGAVTTEKLSVGSSNIIWNSCLYGGSSGWSFWGGNGYSGGGIQGGSARRLGYDVWSLRDYGSGVVHAPISPMPPGWMAIAEWHPVPDLNGTPIVPGKRYGASAQLQAHRCNANVTITWFAADNTYLGEISSTAVGPTSHGNGLELTTYQRVTVHGIAPPGASRASFQVRLIGINDNIPYVFFSQTSFGEMPINATEMGAWAAGGVTQIDGASIRTGTVEADQINANSIFSNSGVFNELRAGIASFGGLRATEIAAGEIRAQHLASDTIITQTLQVQNLILGTEKFAPGSMSTAYGVTTYAGDIWMPSPVPGNIWGGTFRYYSLAQLLVNVSASEQGRMQITFDDDVGSNNLSGAIVTPINDGGGPGDT